MTVQFPPFASATILDFANLHECFKREFPLLQQAARLPPITIPSAQSVSTNVPQTIQFAPMALSAMIPRVFLISSDLHKIIQFQDDRFGFNWRRIEPLTDDFSYPGYVALKAEFSAIYTQFAEWARTRFSEAPKPIIAELFYSNAIPLKTETGVRRLSRVYKFFTPQAKKPISNFNVAWKETIEGDTPGYTQMNAAVGALPDGVPVATMNLLSHTDISEFSGGAETWFDAAHEKSLEIFAETIFPDETEQ